MAHQKGSTTTIMLGYEDVAFGTVATVGYVMPVNSFGVKPNQALNTAQTLTGTRNPVAPFRGNRNVSGPIVIPLDSVCMSYWLYLMFGDPGVTGAGPYVREFKIGDTMPSGSLEAAFTDLATDKYQRFLGNKVASWSGEFGGDGELVTNIDIIGASDSLENSAFDGSPTSKISSLARVQNFQAAITEGGGALSNATSISFNVNFGLDENTYVIGGSGVRGSLPEGIVAVTGNIKTLFEDSSLLDKAIAGTESSIKITVTASATSIFELEFQEVEYERNSPDISGPQGLLVDLNWQGFYTNGSEASAIVARTTNNVASEPFDP